MTPAVEMWLRARGSGCALFASMPGEEVRIDGTTTVPTDVYWSTLYLTTGNVVY